MLRPFTAPTGSSGGAHRCGVDWQHSRPKRSPRSSSSPTAPTVARRDRPGGRRLARERRGDRGRHLRRRPGTPGAAREAGLGTGSRPGSANLPALLVPATTSARRATSIRPTTCPKGSSRRPPNDAAHGSSPDPRSTRRHSAARRCALAPPADRRERRQARAAHPDEVTWLEEGRLYRFPSSDSALLALLLYSTGLGIGRREARRLAGLPIFTRPRREQVRQVGRNDDRRRPPARRCRSVRPPGPAAQASTSAPTAKSAKPACRRPGRWRWTS